MSESLPELSRSKLLDYGEQDENGIDLSLIRANLRLTPLERLRRGDVARRRALEFMEYGRRHRQEITRRAGS